MRALLLAALLTLPACVVHRPSPDASLFPDTESGNARLAAALLKYHEPVLP